MVLVFLKKKIMCCAVIRSGNFKMLVLLYQLLIGQSLAQLVERCTNVQYLRGRGLDSVQASSGPFGWFFDRKAREEK